MGQLLRNGESINLRRVVEHDHTSAVEGGLLDFAPPIGTIIPFYDFNGALTFNSTFWQYCDGRTVTVGGIGSQVLPDLSNRYLVGFGTEGGGNIDTDIWATSAVGNASHQINLLHAHVNHAHTHVVNAHSHSIPSLNSTGSTGTGTTGSSGAHDHGGRTEGMSLGVTVLGSYGIYDEGAYQVNTGSAPTWHIAVTNDSDSEPEGWHDHVIASANAHVHSVPSLSVSVSSGATSTGNASPTTGDASDHGMSNQLSATQSIQPRSIRVRFLMRVN